MTIGFIFKNGYELKVKCGSFSSTKNGLGQLTGYEMENITENKPIYMDLDEVICVYRVVTDEVEE